MGKTPKKIRRVVLDTNVLISALLFTGEPSKIVELWQRGRFVPLICRETFEELRAVLKYPKFSLVPDEIQSIIESEILPFFEVVEIKKRVKGICRDPEDDKFIDCAVEAKADCIISGDTHLLKVKRYQTIAIHSPKDFLQIIKS